MLPPHRPDGLENEVGLRELACLEFGINLLAIDADLKFSTGRGNERDRTHLLFEAQKLFRQTDGMRLVVSNVAVFDCDFEAHGR